MRSIPAPLRAIVALAVLIPFAGCPGPGGRPVADLDQGQVLDADREGPDTIRRTMECLQKDSDGKCLANKCTEGPGGATYNCGSFAKACIDADLHWKGTNAGGVCSVPL